MLALVVLTQGHICLVLACVHYWETESASAALDETGEDGEDEWTHYTFWLKLF